MVTTEIHPDHGRTYRCCLLAKLLELAGRTDVPIGVGVGQEDKPGLQSGWVGDYQLKDYPGVVHEDGVQAIIDTIHASPEPVTRLVPNIAEALRRTVHPRGHGSRQDQHHAIRHRCRLSGI